ncbi:MAG: hypothetical protein ABSH10_08460 [Phycisphaerae bacterium]
MSQVLSRFGLTILLASIGWMGGCQQPAAPAATMPAKSDDLDQCAERLHDIGGPLLLYYVTHRELPKSLDDLGKVGDNSIPPLVCPISGKPYVYDPVGLPVAGRPGRLIMYDAVPCRPGKRWGILVETPPPGQPLVIRVVCLPEAAIFWQSPPKHP